MGRKARIISSTNIYHIMMRGINKQQIFHEPRDYERLITTLGRYKEISQFELYAYCLMGNHIHLLIRSDHEPIGLAIKRIGDSYVFWYNKKYNR
ncbi:MAG: transposase, partial [Lachnospiraceae bacterium]|nr:transposase [Lachnospiraceae bacterium]